MNLFSLVDNKVETTPECKLIQEFSTLSIEELGYVFFMEDYRSPYTSYTEEVRKEKILKDMGFTLKDTKGLIQKAQLKYNELQDTTSMKLLKAARAGITKLTDYFNNKGPSDRNYVKNLESVGKLTDSLEKLEARVKKEVGIEGRSRGDRSINAFEM